MNMQNERLTIGQMKRDYPGLSLRTMRILCAMNNECATKGRIFRVLPKIILEMDVRKRDVITDILEYAMMRTFLRFMSRSLDERNKMRVEFYKKLKMKIVGKCDDAELPIHVKEHILCAVDAVWRNIHIRLRLENARYTFYSTQMLKFACTFTR